MVTAAEPNRYHSFSFTLAQINETMLWENLNTSIQELMNAEDLNQGLCDSFKLLAQSVHAMGITLVRVRFQTQEEFTVNDELTVVEGEAGWESFSLRLSKKYLFNPPEPAWFCTLQDGNTYGGSTELLSHTWKPMIQRFSLSSFLLFPIKVDRTVWGILSIGSTDPNYEWDSQQQGAIKLYCNTLGNILVRRRGEEKLKEQRDFLRQVIDLNPNFIYAKDRDGRFTLANKAMADLYGTTPNQLIGKPETEFNLHPEQTQQFIEEDLEVMNTLQPKFIPEEIITDFENKDHFIQTFITPIIGSNGKAEKVLGVSTDITEHRLAQFKILEGQQFREIVTSTIPDTVFLIDLQGFSIRYSNTNEFLGFKLDQLENPFYLLLDRVHPEDKTKAMDDIFLALEKDPSLRIAKSEFRMQDAAGNWVWIEKRASVIQRSPDGKILEYLSIIRDIQDKVLAEHMLRENAAVFRSLYEHNPLGIAFATPDHRITRANQVFCRILGYEEHEITQLVFKDFIHPDEYDECIDELKTACRTRESAVVLEKRYVCKNKRIINVSIHLSLIYKPYTFDLDYIIGMVEDVTEKYRVKKALGESKALQKAILNTLPDIKLKINSEGTILDYYPSVNDEIDFFTDVKDLPGKNLSEFVPIPVTVGLLSNAKIALSNREMRYFEFALPLGNNFIYYEARFSAINDQEAIMVLRNISERIKSQETLQEKLRELDEKNRQLRAYIDSNMQLENFAYIASHDIREPLRTMRTFAQLLETRYQHTLDQDGRDYVNFIAGAAKNMNQLIEDLLIYSRVEFEEYEVEAVDLNQLLGEILLSLGEIIESRQAQISWGTLPHLINGNPSRLKQLFQNLIINAIKFGPPGGRPFVRIQCKSVDRFCQFSITDNGIGIPTEFYDKIFLIFKKLHGKGQYEGTGIGLALCKKIVEQHGGRIWVESTPGVGSTFYFTLPH